MPTIKRVETPEDLHQVGRLRYKVYVEEMGRCLAHADHQQEVLIEPFDKHGRVLAAFDDSTGDVVGTIRINIGSESDFAYYRDLFKMDYFAPYYPAGMSVTTKLIVADNWRGTTLPMRLCLAAWDEGYSAGVVFDCIECKPPLKPFYERFGWRQVFPDICHPENGPVSPLVLVGYDWRHLDRVKSPFVRRVKRDLDHPSVDRFYSRISRCAESQLQELL